MNTITFTGFIANDAELKENQTGKMLTYTVFINVWDSKAKENKGIPIYCSQFVTDARSAFLLQRIKKGEFITGVGSLSANLVRNGNGDSAEKSALLCVRVSEVDFAPQAKAQSEKQATAAPQSNNIEDDLPF